MIVDRSDLASRLAEGGALAAGDVDELASSPDLIALGMAADAVRRRRHGDRTTFVRVAEVDAAAVPPASADCLPPAAREWRMAGWPGLEAAADRVRALVGLDAAARLTGFSLADVEAEAGSSLEAALAVLRDAGLQWLAEAPVDRLADPAAALGAAGAAGLRIARLTVRAAPADPLAFLRRVGALTGGGIVRAFAPLPRATAAPQPATGYDDVRLVALARLVVDNIESIQVDWALYGPKLAQVALTFGADDVDMVSPLDSAELGPRRGALEEIRRNIRAAVLVPVERDGWFETV